MLESLLDSSVRSPSWKRHGTQVPSSVVRGSPRDRPASPQLSRADRPRDGDKATRPWHAPPPQAATEPRSYKPVGRVRHPRSTLPAHAADIKPSSPAAVDRHPLTSDAFGNRDCPGDRSTRSRNHGLTALNGSARPDATQLDPIEDSAANGVHCCSRLAAALREQTPDSDGTKRPLHDSSGRDGRMPSTDWKRRAPAAPGLSLLRPPRASYQGEEVASAGLRTEHTDSQGG
jgi:hypothetical protein